MERHKIPCELLQLLCLRNLLRSVFKKINFGFINRVAFNPASLKKPCIPVVVKKYENLGDNELKSQAVHFRGL